MNLFCKSVLNPPLIAKYRVKIPKYAEFHFKGTQLFIIASYIITAGSLRNLGKYYDRTACKKRNDKRCRNRRPALWPR